MENIHFNCFGKFWDVTHHLDEFQRKIIFDSLSDKEKEILIYDIKEKKWEDLIYRNKLDHAINDIKELLGIDILDIKRQIIKGKYIYIKKSDWEYIIDYINSITSSKKHTNYILGGLDWYSEGEHFLLQRGVNGKKNNFS